MTRQTVGFSIAFLSASLCFVYYTIRILVLYSRGRLRPGMDAEQRYQVLRRLMVPGYILMGMMLLGLLLMVLPG